MKKYAHKKFAAWLKTDIGRAFLALEIASLPKNLTENRAPSVLLGEEPQLSLVKHLTLLLTGPTEDKAGFCQEEGRLVFAHHHELPLKPESIEHAILPHTLDFSSHPNAILREVHIALQAGGQMTIIGFNPLSLWGLRRLFSVTGRAPWCGRFRSVWKIKSQLDLLNYEVVHYDKWLYGLPILKNRWFARFGWLQKILRSCFPFSGAVYILVARKKVFGVTPLKPKWKKIPAVLASPVMKPSLNRESKHENSSNLY